jgi:hypothetical protein
LYALFEETIEYNKSNPMYRNDLPEISAATTTEPQHVVLPCAAFILNKPTSAFPNSIPTNTTDMKNFNSHLNEISTSAIWSGILALLTLIMSFLKAGFLPLLVLLNGARMTAKGSLKKLVLPVTKKAVQWGVAAVLLLSFVVSAPGQTTIGGVNMGNLTDYLFVFTNGSVDANWQSASKGFIGNVAVDGNQADERTSGDFAYAGTIYTNSANLSEWADIVDNNDPGQVSPAQAFGSFNQNSRISNLEANLASAFSQINALTATPGYTSVSSTSLNGLNTQNSVAEVFVINITSGLNFSSKINITGDANDVFFLRWDTDANFSNGYQGEVKPQSGGAIVPLGGLKPTNFINVAGAINSSGGGSNPGAPYPQGPRTNDGTGSLIANASNFSGGGFFTGYWLTTGDPSDGENPSLSNGIFVGGWYTSATKFSLTSGTSAVYVSPPTATACTLDNVTTGPDVSICRGSSVTIMASATGGATPYTFNWSNGLGAGNSKTVSPTTTTTYSVTATDANGCSGVDNIVVTVNPTPTVTIAKTNATCGQNNGTATATATAGTAPYTYNWSNGLGTGPTKNNLSAGTYSVTVVDANGCVGLASVTIASANSNLLVNISCASDPITQRTLTNSTQTCGSQNYAFFSGSLVSAYTSNTYWTASGATFQEFANGTAVASMQVVNQANSNLVFDMKVVFRGRTFTPPAGSPKENTQCIGNVNNSDWYYYPEMEGILTGAGALAGAVVKIIRVGESFQVGTGANLNAAAHFGASGWLDFQILSQPTAGAALNNSSHGDYNVKLSGSTLVNTPPACLTICAGTSTVLTANVVQGTNVSYAWSTGATTASITVSPATTTTYSVTITSGGCTASDQVTVTVIPSNLNPGTIGSDETSCAGYDAEIIIEITPASGGTCGEESAPVVGESCCETSGFKPAQITMRYTGEACGATVTTQPSDKWACSGNPGMDASVYIISNDDSNPNNGDIWFAGTVSLNGTYVINAANAGQTKLASNTYVHIYSELGGTLLQTVNFHTSCSQPLATGNQFGANLILNIVAESGAVCGSTTGTNPIFTYQWETRVGTSGSWTSIPGATGINYDPGIINQTTQFRRITSDCCSGRSSNVVTKTVTFGTITAGEIGSDESNCGAYDPAVMVGISVGDCGVEYDFTGEDCCDNGDKPRSFVLLYNGESCANSNNNQGVQGGKWDCNGDAGGDPSVYIVANNNQFAGTVALNGTFTASNGGNDLTNPIVLSIYSQQGGTLLQTIEIHTSCSAPIVNGDQFGSLVLISSVYANGTVCGSAPSGTGAVTYQWQSREGTSGTFQNIPGATGASYDPTLITATTQYRRLESCACGDGISNIVTKEVFVVDPGEIGSDEANCDPFDPAEIISITDAANACTNTVTFTGEDCCESGIDKIAQITMLYTGENCGATSTTQPSDKWSCSGNPAFDNSVWIKSNDDEDPNDNSNVWFTGTVSLNGTYVIRAANAGETKLASATFVHIFSSQGGTLLQTVEFHTSCSQPIAVGDQFGANQILGIVGENGATCGDGLPPLDNTITYQWERRTGTSGSWTTIPGATSENYDPPFISTTTQYRRVATNCCSTGTSNIVTKEVVNQCVELVKNFVSATPNSDGTFSVVYQIIVSNSASAPGVYTLRDTPGFDNDVTINSGAFSGYASGALGAGTNTLITNEPIGPGNSHEYNLTFNVTLDLSGSANDPGGDNVYTPCGSGGPNGNGMPGQGLYNLATIDTNGDGQPDLQDDACGDLPNITLDKELISVTSRPDGSYRVLYRITVVNNGGADGNYTLTDSPLFDDDVTITAWDYTFVDVGAGIGNGPAFLGSPIIPINLGTNLLTAGNTHIYTLGFDVTLDVSGSTNDPGGDNVYTFCGTGGPRGNGMPGQGLYNLAELDTTGDGQPDQEDDACGNLPPPTCIGDLVFEDLNGDGLQTPGEPGIPGVTVTVYTCTTPGEEPTPGSGTPVGTDVTDANGLYEICVPTDFSYYVQFTLPDGSKVTTQDAGNNNNNDSDANAAGTTVCTFLPPGTPPIDSIDLGIVFPASLGDFVWEDINNNGIQNAGEPGVPGVTVTLTDENGDPVVDFDGNPVTSTTTGPNGEYSFGNLEPGDYIVIFSGFPNDFNVVTPNQGGDDALDSDADPVTGATPIVNLESGENDPTIDAGLNNICDDIFVGAGISGIGLLCAPEDGSQLFTLLTATPPPGASPNISYSWEVSTVSENGPFETIDQANGEDYNAAAQTFGQWFRIVTRNSETCTTEFFSSAFLVQIFNLDLSAQVEGIDCETGEGRIDLTVTTDDFGPITYAWTGPAGFTSAEEDITVTVSGTYTVVVNSGVCERTLSVFVDNDVSLGDLVFEDLNGDGLQTPGEPGIPGVTVTVYTCTTPGEEPTPGSGTPAGTDVTDANGLYEICVQTDASYYVQFTLPDGSKVTTQDAGNNNNNDSDGNAAGTTVCTFLPPARRRSIPSTWA